MFQIEIADRTLWAEILSLQKFPICHVTFLDQSILELFQSNKRSDVQMFLVSINLGQQGIFRNNFDIKLSI